MLVIAAASFRGALLSLSCSDWQISGNEEIGIRIVANNATLYTVSVIYPVTVIILFMVIERVKLHSM